MKFILKYLTQLFKPKFIPTKEDLLILENKVNNKENTFETKQDKIAEYHVNLDILLTIHEQAKQKTKKVYFDSGYIEFKKLDIYKNFIKQHSEIRVSFLYFLIKVLNIPPASVYHIQTHFKTALFASVLSTKLNVTDKVLHDFFIFWKSKDYYALKIPLHLLTKKITDFSSEHNLSKAFLSTLEKYATHIPTVDGYNTHEKDNDRIYRTIINQKFKKEAPIFFLLPDYFGKKVTEILLQKDHKHKEALATILYLVSLKKKKNNQKQQTQDAIDTLGKGLFQKEAIEILRIASAFKPKLKLAVFWHGYLRKNVCVKSYFKMFDENVMIICGLLHLLTEHNLIRKLPLQTISAITKRSYTLKQNIKLARSSTKLGDTCIEILALHCGKEGKKELKNIYNEFTYKNVRRKIEILSEKVKTIEGESFL